MPTKRDYARAYAKALQAVADHIGAHPEAYFGGRTFAWTRASTFKFILSATIAASPRR